MPFEVVLALLILFVAFPAVLFRGVAHLRRSKSPPSKAGLRASELRSIIHESVEEATAPLHDRIDTLEGLLMGATALPEGRIDAALLDESDELADARSAPQRVVTS